MDVQVITRSKLAGELARVTDLTRKDAVIVIALFFHTIESALGRGEKVELRGFGTFRVHERRAHRGRNPKTGEAVFVPARRFPHFKPVRELKALLNS